MFFGGRAPRTRNRGRVVRGGRGVRLSLDRSGAPGQRAGHQSYLAGHVDVALPAFLVSLVLLAFCAAIYAMVVRLDRAPEPEEHRPVSTSGPWEI